MQTGKIGEEEGDDPLERVRKHVNDREIDSTFRDIDISGKENFLSSLREFIEKNTDFILRT